MKVKEIGFGLTVHLGDYESARFDLKAELEPGENPEESVKALKETLVRIAAVELQNDNSYAIRKLGLDRKYIKEIQELGKELDELRRQRSELIDEIQSVKFDMRDARSLLTAFKNIDHYNSVVRDLREVVQRYENLMNAAKEKGGEVEDDDSGSEF